MADNTVFITGVGSGAFDGALEKAFGELPKWATQETLEQIAGYLRKSLEIQTDGFNDLLKASLDCCQSGGAAGSVDPQMQKAVNDELDKYLRNLRRNNAEDDKNRARAARREKEAEENSKKSQALGVTAGLLSRTFNLLSIAGSKILLSQQQYFVTSNDLYKSGINLLNGNNSTRSSMLTLNQMISDTGLRLETMQKIMEEYSSSINAIGPKKFGEALRESRTGLVALGYNSKEQADLMATMVDSMSNYEDMRSLSNVEISRRTTEFGSYLTRMSLMMGESTTSLKNKFKSISEGSDAYIVASRRGAEASSKFNEFLLTIKDEGFRKLVGRLGSAGPYAGATKEFGELVRAGMGPLANQILAVTEQAMTDPVRAQSALMEVAANQYTGSVENLNLQMIAGNSEAASTLGYLSSIQQQYNKQSLATKEQTDDAIKNQSSISKVQTENERLQAQLQRTFPLLESQVEMFSNLLGKLNQAVETQVDKFDPILRSWTGIAMAAASVLGAFTILAKGASLLGGGAAAGAAGAAGVGLLSGTAAGAAGAAIGYGIGSYLVNPLLDGLAQTATGNKDASLGTAIYEMFHSDEDAKIAKMLNPGTTINNTHTKVVSPAAPQQTTIKSPSASKPSTTVAPVGSTDSQNLDDRSTGTTLDRPAANSDINSLLNFQSDILQQVLQETRNLVSVNKDILKFSKNH